MTPDASSQRTGLLICLATYVMWGFMPLVFILVKAASPTEILGQRIVWSFVVCMVLWLARRDMRWVGQALHNPRQLALVTVAAITVAMNWGFYIYSVTTGHVVEASLGYFINPLMTVLVGVVVLQERLRRLQWVAIGLGAVAVAVITVDYGRPPWLALALAITFTLYGFIKNRVGPQLGALEGLSIETAVLLPLAVAYLIWLQATGAATFLRLGLRHLLAMIFTGPATAIPLIMFAAAARRIPLSMIGLVQFVSPVMTFIIGVFALNESVSRVRLIGFGLVWLALVLLVVDSLRLLASQRAERRAIAR